MNEQAALYLQECVKSFRGLKSNAEKAIAQISDEELHVRPDPASNNIAILMQHLCGNMKSRFSEFLTTDGEKANRNRDGEFEDLRLTREQLFSQWNEGWNILFQSVESLQAKDLLSVVTIRNEPHTVVRALQRQLVHYAYHCGQIVFLCKHIRSENFKTLSIEKGQSGKFITKPPDLLSNT